ncbi:MAG: long-chain fatty acid--CoA ligase [Pseudomonadota bacterium]|nr:long-chain fatty acid--CoA ligase [Pseudomonadota bacterium]
MGTPDQLHTDLISSDEAGTLYGLFRRRVERSPEAVGYKQYDPQAGQWRDYTWSQMSERAARWRRALEQERLEPGDRVAILLRNSVEWVCCDQAAFSRGLVVVPLYTVDNPENIAYILGDSGSRLLLLESAEQWLALSPHRAAFPALESVVFLEQPPAAVEGIVFHPAGRWLPDQAGDPPAVELDADALASIVYTSGTTGRPKGVMLSHRNLLWDAEAVARSVSPYTEDLFLSFLPLSHAFERTVGYYVPMMGGSCVAYARSIKVLAEDLLTIRPTVLISVPRIYEKVYARVKNQLLEKGWPAQVLFDKAVALGWQRFQAGQGRGRVDIANTLLWPLLRRMVAEKITARLGGRIRLAVSGGAPLPENIARCFIGLGLPVLQGYGLTESAPVVSANRLEDNLPASVGPPLPGLEVQLGKQDELLVRSPGTMLGYWNRPQDSRAVIDDEGWLHTGDIAEISDGRITIRGRLKEIIVTDTGQKIPPADLEMVLCEDPLIEQAMVVGEGKPYVGALLVLDGQEWQKFAQSRALDADPAEVLRTPAAIGAMLDKVAGLLHAFPVYAQLHGLYLTFEPWTIENGLITPTMKLKRSLLERTFSAEIEALYEGHVTI